MDEKMIPPEGTAFIKVGNTVALVDADMVGPLSEYTWHLNPKGYAVGYLEDNTNRTVPMHRIVNGTPKGKETDHINRVKLDNRRCNLRTCTRQENSRNVPARGKVPYKGVYIHRDKRNALTYAAHIRINGKLTMLGYFDSPTQAAQVYDNAARQLHGEFAVLNFP